MIIFSRKKLGLTERMTKIILSVVKKTNSFLCLTCVLLRLPENIEICVVLFFFLRSFCAIFLCVSYWQLVISIFHLGSNFSHVLPL